MSTLFVISDGILELVSEDASNFTLKYTGIDKSLTFRVNVTNVIAVTSTEGNDHLWDEISAFIPSDGDVDWVKRAFYIIANESFKSLGNIPTVSLDIEGLSYLLLVAKSKTGFYVHNDTFDPIYLSPPYSYLTSVETVTPNSHPISGKIAELGGQTYIGTKILHATPMTRGDYNSLRGWVLPEDEDPDDKGYLVQYADNQSSNCEGFTGYVSWTPVDVFNKSYRPL